MPAESEASLKDMLREIRFSIEAAMSAVEDEGLDGDDAATVWQGLDAADEEVAYILMLFFSE